MVRKVKKSDLKTIYKICQGVSLDRDRLGDIQYRLQLEKKGFLLGLDDKATYLKLLKESPIFLVHEEKGKILGYIVVTSEQTYIDDESKIWFNLEAKNYYYKSPQAIQISALAIDPKAHKKGIATILLKAAEKELVKKEYRYLFSIVTINPITNCPSIIFHTKNNFERIAYGRPRKLFNIENYASILFFKELKHVRVKVSINLDNCQAKTISQGVIYLGPSNKNQSLGFLKLNPKEALARHNRPVAEKLKQIKGSCTTEFYKGDRLIKEKRLTEGDELIIPANQYHVHKNPTNKESFTYWQFDGDIREIIASIRKSKD